MIQRIVILRGLPSSGKTTWAKQQIEEHSNTFKRINKDDLRLMLDNSHWSKGNEKFVLDLRDHLIIQALKDNKIPIIDDTNLNSEHELHIRELIKEYNGLQESAGSKKRVQIEIKFFDVPVDECVERDKYRPNPVGEKVIREMYTQFLMKPEVFPSVQYNPDLQDAIICDLDGTLALRTGNRGPYDYALCEEDALNPVVYQIIAIFAIPSLRWNVPMILLISGREDWCEPQTREWLRKNNVPFHSLHMRKTGDKRKDSIVKKEIYGEFVKDKYNVLFVLDDRLQVCRMWYQLGLPLLRVGDPDADF